MKFRTEIKVTDAPRNLSPERLVLLAGSCFSDNIGSRMASSGWSAMANPCGVIYNPISMALLFRLALVNPVVRREIVESSLTMREGKFVTWLMGLKVFGSTAGECVEKACEAIGKLEEGLHKAQAIILTFGTSDLWLLKGTDRAVGNCHKHPAAEFEKRRAGIAEIVSIWKELLEVIRERNPEVKVIFTISPRRYLSEGAADNSRQKAVLILACEEIVNTEQAKGNRVYYFPAYEILNDDLRDYRFYSEDLLHPSVSGVEYIWEKFIDSYLDRENLELLREMETKERRRRHRQIL